MAAHHKSCCIGTDIDGRQMRGKNQVSIATNLKHYNLEEPWMASIVMDIKHHAWSSVKPIFDCIVCDPPYGVRAGAKVYYILNTSESM
jgi:tRNA (guanine10-N2)-methyltransferase